MFVFFSMDMYTYQVLHYINFKICEISIFQYNYEGIFVVYKKELLQLIECKRKELILIVSQYGLNSSRTIQYSQELDSLLNVYNKKA